MRLLPTALPEVLLLEPRRHHDARGHVAETWDAWTWRHATFSTDVEALSRSAGTLRGLHAQLGDAPQGKLVRCAAGAMRDVVVDATPGSPTFGRWMAVELTAANGHQLYIPPGHLHGYVTLEPNTLTLYKMTCPYAPDHQVAVRWDDPALGIDWQIAEPLLSDRDRAAPLFHEVFPP